MASQETQKPLRGRGRGYTRGRGRGRGRGYRANKSLPSIEERVAQIRELKPVEEKVAVPNAPTTDKLSAMMDTMYPSSSAYLHPFSDVMIDMFSYCNIVERTYVSMIECKKGLSDLLSYDEFALVMGWILVRRILSVRSSIYQEVNASEVVFSNIPPDLDVPGPISTCLNSLGYVRSPSGVVMVPDICIPAANVDYNYQRGLYPARTDSGYMGNPVYPHLIPSMYPFWLYKRRISYYRSKYDEWDDDCFSKEDPENEKDEKRDAYLNNMEIIPGLRNTGLAMTKARYSQYPIKFNEEKGSLLGSLAFSGTILGSYLSFVHQARDVMHFNRVKKDTSGNSCLLGWVEHDDSATRNNEYRVYSSYLLPSSDMQGVRIFKWRRAVIANRSPRGDPGAFASFDLHPDEIKVKNREIDKVINDTVLLHDYVSKYLK